MTEPFPGAADIARRANDLYRAAVDRSVQEAEDTRRLADVLSTGLRGVVPATEAWGQPGPVRVYPLLEAPPVLQPALDSSSYYFLDPVRGPAAPPAAVGVAGGAVQAARSDFPALHQQVNGRPLVWLDNAATTQKPRAVIDALTHYYEHDNSNVHRGAHTLAARATDAYEGARASVARLLGAPSPECLVFVRGTTEGGNLLASTLGRQRVGPGDDIVVTTLEHHANIVPWQMLAKAVGARLRAYRARRRERERQRRERHERTEADECPARRRRSTDGPGGDGLRRAAATSCAWCGGVITPRSPGPIPKWCSATCRHRAWEQTRAAASGRSAVHEVERRVVVPTAVPLARPRVLRELTAQLDDGRVYDRDVAGLSAELRSTPETSPVLLVRAGGSLKVASRAVDD